MITTIRTMTTSTPINRRITFDYHLGAGSPAIDEGSPDGAGGALGALGAEDFDNDPRPGSVSGVAGTTDIGADEVP